MTREEILAAAQKCVCGDREQDYGSPERSFGVIGQFWETYLREKCLGPVEAQILPEDVAEALGSKLWLTCDTDQIALDAAEMLEADTETISALIDDRKYYIEKYEKLKSRVPRHNCVPPEEGADDDEA